MVRFSKNSFIGIKTLKLLSISLIFIIIGGLMAIFIPVNVYAENGASAMVVIEQNSKRVLLASNENAELPMASTTKVMTAITALEFGKLDDKIKVPKSAVGIEGSSIYLKEGEVLTLEELLYGLMLRSGNDAAVTIAQHIGGSLENFCHLMNETAKRIGATNSNFVNPHGLPQDNHYTTAYDLAKITAYALKNQHFAKIVSTKSIRFEEESGNTRVFANKNKFLSLYDGGNGVKTGYTKEAGRCLVSSAKRNGMQLVCVVLNCPMMWEQSASNMDFCFDNYNLIKIAQKGELPNKLFIDTEGKPIRLSLDSDLYYPLKSDESLKFDFSLNTIENLTFPISAGDIVAKLNVYHEKQLIFEENVFSIDNANQTSAQRACENRSVIINGKTQ